MSQPSSSHLSLMPPVKTQRELFEMAAKELGYTIEVVGTLRRSRSGGVISEQQVLKISHGGKSLLNTGATTDQTSYLGMKFAVNKAFTSTYLSKHGIPVPFQKGLATAEDGVAMLATHTPIVIKPSASRAGKGVFGNVRTPEQAAEAFWSIRKLMPESDIIAEEQIEGKEFRVVVIDGKFEAAVYYKPAEVVGDGVSTIQQLIEKENGSPKRKADLSLYPIKINAALEMQLAAHNLSLETVPMNGAPVELHRAAPISNGGTVVDVTDEISPENILFFEEIAKIMHINIVGIDVITSSLAEPVRIQGKIIEVNGGPDLRIHFNVHEGTRRNIAKTVLKNFFEA